VGDRLKMNIVVATASPQSQLSMGISFIVLLAMPIIDGFRHSTTSFCSRVYGAVK
jgi:hypothetical protein